jgi:hypothetical protein
LLLVLLPFARRCPAGPMVKNPFPFCRHKLTTN